MLISRSTILILSAWLVGISMGRTLPPGVETYALVSGLGGLAGHCGFTWAARRRTRVAAQQRSRDAREKLAQVCEEILHLSTPAPAIGRADSNSAGGGATLG